MANPAPFHALEGHKYLQLLTFRKSGEPVNTPVWFAVSGERLFFSTDDPSGKIKRIRNNPHVTVAPCTVTGKALGPSSNGTARVLEDREEKRIAEDVLRRRYGWFRKLWMRTAVRCFEFMGLETVWVEVTPREVAV